VRVRTWREKREVLIMVAPGQGAQTPGFLAPWLDLPGAAERFARWSELAEVDIVRMGTEAGSGEITDTAAAQPLLAAAALFAAELLDRPAMAAGHSVGELAAGTIAGVISAHEAMWLTGIRGRAMAAATRATPTGMTAVLGGEEQAVLAALARHGLTASNINASGQIVVGGTRAQLAALAASPPAGARLRPLRVAGAFHTAHMAPAVESLAAAVVGLAVQDPAITLLSNQDGGVVVSGNDWLERIVGQVAAPVRWDRCTETMRRLGVTALIELPPAGTLAGIARRALPDVTTVPIKTPEDLPRAREVIARSGLNNPVEDRVAARFRGARRDRVDGESRAGE
jgi:[acyl-carrier-protein] S-malonyltransferase